ncbi:DUF2953 domain-containing protein [Roseburia hominis]
MLHIIGLILKIIGVILAVILGILVLLVCIVLFVPVRYEIRGQFSGKLEEAKASLAISWLLHLIAVRVRYEEGNLRWKVRAAWIRRDSGKTMEKKVIAESKKKEKIDGNAAEGAEKELLEEKKLSEQKSDLERKTSEGEKQCREGEQTENETDRVKCETEADKKGVGEETEALGEAPRDKQSKEQGRKKRKRKKRKPLRLILRELIEKIKGFFAKIKYTFGRICDKLKTVSRKKEQIAEFLENEMHKSALARVKKEFVWVKRFLKPKKFRADLQFGFEDPYHTGQALAVLGMIYPFTGNHMNINPDFSRRMLEGEAYLKGNLRAVHLMMFALKVLLDKNVRRTYRDVRRVLNR